MGYYTWTTTRSGSDAEVWYGITADVEFCDPATTPWQELYHEGDYQGIVDQLRAEDLGYV